MKGGCHIHSKLWAEFLQRLTCVHEAEQRLMTQRLKQQQRWRPRSSNKEAGGSSFLKNTEFWQLAACTRRGVARTVCPEPLSLLSSSTDFPLFLHSLTSLTSNYLPSLLFGRRERLGGQSLFRQTRSKRTQGVFVLGRAPTGPCFASVLPFL